MANKSQTGLGVVDSSIASLTGSSQTLMAEDDTRGALVIHNCGLSNALAIAFVPLGALPSSVTAALGAAGSYNIAPGGYFPIGGGFIPTNAIVVAGTAGQPVSAFKSQ